jgi:Protein of unknown function (DUF3263)
MDDSSAIERVPQVGALLGFERSWRQLGMPKARAIRDRLGVSPTRYHQLLNAALDEPAVIEIDPGLVLRLRRLRETRRARRARSPLRALG